MKTPGIVVAVICFLFLHFNIHAQIKINELMAANDHAVYDEDYLSSDWLELYNSNSSVVSLKGWRISDKFDFAGAWQLPDISMSPNSFLRIFASGKNRTSSEKYIMKASGAGLFPHSIVEGHRFEYLPCSGDFDVSVQVNSLRDMPVWGNAGIVVKENLSDQGFFAAIVCLSPIRKSFAMIYRDTLSHFPKRIYSKVAMRDRGNLRLVRIGDSIKGYVTDSKGALIDSMSVGLKLKADCYVGISLSVFEQAGLACAAFSHLTVNNSAVDFDDLQKIEFHCDIPGTSYYSEELHTDFKLSDGGEQLYLWDENGKLADSVNFGVQKANISYGRYPDGSGEFFYSEEYTPEKANLPGYLSFAENPRTTIKQGLYHEKQETGILSNSPESDIYYTYDFSEPDTNKPIYNNEIISISDVSTIKFQAHQAGSLPSDKIGKTFLINPDTELPILSISGDPDYFWNDDYGLLIDKNIFSEYEYPVYFYFFDPINSSDYGSYGIMKLHGNCHARSTIQPSFRIHSRDSIGDNNFDYNFFGAKSLTSYDKILLRNGGQDKCNCMIRDGIGSILALELPELAAQRFRPVTLYLNGDYWGVYNLLERIDEEYLATKYKIEKTDIDLINTPQEIISGNIKDFIDFIDIIEMLDTYDSNLFYDYVDSVISFMNYIDYISLEVWSGNTDWLFNNIKYWKSEVLDNKWRWICLDLDLTMNMWISFPESNSLKRLIDEKETNTISLMFSRLMQNTKIRNMFCNRIADLMHTNFSGERIGKKVDSLVSLMRLDMQRHVQRWPDCIEDWEANMQRITEFAELRPLHLFEHIAEAFELPGIARFSLSSSDSGACAFRINSITIDKSSWSGDYFRSVPVTVTAIPKDGYEFVGWSDNAYGDSAVIVINAVGDTALVAHFRESSPDQDNLVINEIMYRTADNKQTGDWFELYNPTDSIIKPGGWSFCDSDSSHRYIFPDNTAIGPHGFLVVCRDLEAFRDLHPEVSNAVGDFDFGLGKRDMIRLYNQFGALSDSVAYTNEAPWPLNSDGTGYSIELINPTFPNNRGENWKSSIPTSGTPGSSNSIFLDSGNYQDVRFSAMCFPNPVADRASLQLVFSENTIARIVIVDAAGTVVQKSAKNEYFARGANYYLLDMSHLSAGAYFCRIETLSPHKSETVVEIIHL